MLKGEEVAARLGDRVVLSADTIVALGPLPTDVLGKPQDDEQALRMLGLLSGREHEVLTAVALFAGGRQAVRTARTTVAFAPLPVELLQRYVATGEPRDKAGAYGAQGRIGSHVEGVRGSWTNVVGLPLEVLPGLFSDLGLDLRTFQAW